VTRARPDRGTPDPASCSPPVRLQLVRESGCTCRSSKKAVGEREEGGGGGEVLNKVMRVCQQYRRFSVF
jgi:hypothetical protein